MSKHPFLLALLLGASLTGTALATQTDNDLTDDQDGNKNKSSLSAQQDRNEKLKVLLEEAKEKKKEEEERKRLEEEEEKLRKELAELGVNPDEDGNLTQPSAIKVAFPVSGKEINLSEEVTTSGKLEPVVDEEEDEEEKDVEVNTFGIALETYRNIETHFSTIFPFLESIMNDFPVSSVVYAPSRLAQITTNSGNVSENQEALIFNLNGTVPYGNENFSEVIYWEGEQKSYKNGAVLLRCKFQRNPFAPQYTSTNHPTKPNYALDGRQTVEIKKKSNSDNFSVVFKGLRF